MPGHNVLQEIFEADFTVELPDPLGTIVVDRSPCYLDIVTTSSNENRTLHDPTRAGLQMFIYFLTDGGDAIIIGASAFNVSGNTFITFDDEGDFCQLLSVSDGSGGYRWQAIAYTGVAFS